MSVQIFDCILEDKCLLENGELTKGQAERVKAMILAGSKGLQSSSPHPDDLLCPRVIQFLPADGRIADDYHVMAAAIWNPT